MKYGNIKKVYSIWLCTEAAQIRANSIEKYEISRDFLVGSNSDNPRYDILTAIIINISGKHDTAGTGSELIKMLTDLFDERLDGVEKVNKLKSSYGLKLTKDVESEVCDMCSYADAMENKGVEIGEEKGIKIGEKKGIKIGEKKGIKIGEEKGLKAGIEKGLKALVRSLKEYTSDFDAVYNSVIKNEDFSEVTKDHVMKYFKD